MKIIPTFSKNIQLDSIHLCDILHQTIRQPTDNTAQGLICFFLHNKTLPGTILPPIKKYLWSTWLNKRQQCALDVYVIGTYSFGFSTVTSFSVLNQQQNCNDHELINWSHTNKFHNWHTPYSLNSLYIHNHLYCVPGFTRLACYYV